MQISRHWRMNSQRYRLEGIRYENGEVSLQNRPVPVQLSQEEEVMAAKVSLTERDVQQAVVSAA